MHKYFMFLSFFIVLISGCGTSPTQVNQSKPIPDERIFYTPSSVLNAVEFIVIRDSGLHGAEHYHQIWINGSLAAKLNASEIYKTKVEPGEIVLELRMFNVLGKIHPVQIETNFRPNRKYVYRSGLDDSPSLHFTRDMNLSTKPK